MTAPTVDVFPKLATCPPWCVSTHRGDDLAVHFQADTLTESFNDGDLMVGAVTVDGGHARVFIGSYELSLTNARKAAADIVAAADLAEQAVAR